MLGNTMDCDFLSPLGGSLFMVAPQVELPTLQLWFLSSSAVVDICSQSAFKFAIGFSSPFEFQHSLFTPGYFYESPAVLLK